MDHIIQHRPDSNCHPDSYTNSHDNSYSDSNSYNDPDSNQHALTIQYRCHTFFERKNVGAPLIGARLAPRAGANQWRPYILKAKTILLTKSQTTGILVLTKELKAKNG